MTRTEAVTVGYATADGTATSSPDGVGADFASGSGTLTFAAATGAALTQTVSVATTPDEISEENETFTLALSSVSPNAVIGTGTARGTINDDDGTPSLSVADASAAEGEAVVFTVEYVKGKHRGRDGGLRVRD